VTETQAKSLFLRDATGLLKPWSLWDGYIYNVFAVNAFLIYGATFVNGYGISPGVNMWLALIIVAVTSTFLAYNEAALIASMPRSGGDYVFQSRILSGGVGYVLTWGLMLVNQPAIFGVLAGWWLATMVLAPFLTIYGATLNIPALTNLGLWMTTQIGIFAMAVIAAIWSTYINLAGMKAYRRLQKWFFAVGVVSFGIVLVLLAIYGIGGFPAAFDQFGTSVVGVSPGAYQGVLNEAYKLGFTADAAPPTDAIIVSMPFAFGAMAVAWSAFNAGEIKGASSLRSQMVQVVGASVTSAALSFVLLYVITAVSGDLWYRAASWLYWNYPTNYTNVAGPIAPFFGLVLAILFFRNPIGLLTVFIAFQAWFWMWYPNIQLAVSRYMLALSFDRAFPAVFAKVSDRFKTPHVSVLVIFVLALIWSWIFSFPQYIQYTVLVSLIGIIGYAGSALAGVAMPWKRKDLFRASPASAQYLGPIPVIVICGGVWVIYSIICSWLFLTDPAFFVYNPVAVAFFVLTFATGAASYYAFKLYRRKQGINLKLLYTQIPVE